MPLIFPDRSVREISGLIANLSALAFDFAARQKIGGTTLNYFLLYQLPVLPPDFYTEPRLTFITPKVLELTYTSHSLAPFARDLGYDGPPYPWDDDRRAHLRADLDAFYARAYGLTRDELRYILDPADVMGEDYPSETFRVLKEKEIRLHGEYRTRDLVLKAWNRMEADGTFIELGLADGVATPAQQPIEVPPLDTLADGAWARPAPNPQFDPATALAALLKSVSGPTPSRTLRLAVIMMLEPHLFTPLLTDTDRPNWQRLIGQEAAPQSGNVTALAAHSALGWNTAITNHRGNGRLIEDLVTGTWAPGQGLDAFNTSGWADGRAQFAMRAIAELGFDTVMATASDPVREFVNAA